MYDNINESKDFINNKIAQRYFNKINIFQMFNNEKNYVARWFYIFNIIYLGQELPNTINLPYNR